MDSNNQALLMHFLFSFFVPGAIALILYPYCRIYRKDWTRMIIYAVSAAVLVIVSKEWFDKTVSVDDIAADLLGIFFGTAFLAMIFTLGDKRMTRQAPLYEQSVSLRDFLLLAKEIEEQSAVFYFSAADTMSEIKSKELCFKIGFEEKRHAESIAGAMEKWLPRRPDPGSLRWAKKELVRQGFYMLQLRSAAPADVLKYAIAQEQRNIDYYLHLINAFPDEGKKGYVQAVIDGDASHKKRLEDALRALGK